MSKRTREEFTERIQDAQTRIWEAKRLVNEVSNCFLKDTLAGDEAELDAIFTRLGKRVDEFEVGRVLDEDEWNDRYRTRSPASCGTTCRSCESHVGGDQPVYGGLCLLCATEVAREKESEGDRAAREEESEGGRVAREEESEGGRVAWEEELRGAWVL